MAKQKTPRAIVKVDNELALNVEQELFCQLYVNSFSDYFGNGTASYAAAYNLAIYTKSGKVDKKKYKVANANGSRLLANASIKKRIYQLLNESMKDEIVDGELSKVILQDRKLAEKVAAIRVYNQIKGRVKDTTPVNAIQININDDREKYK